MHENVILVVDYEKICRLCLHSTGAMSDIFEINGETCLTELILCATGLKISKGDGLPSNICHKCRYIVELSCEFRQLSTKAHSLLIEASSNEHLATEYLEGQCNTENENKCTEIQTNLQNKNYKGKQDLKLVLQDNGILTLVNKDHINGFEDTNDRVEDLNDVKDKTKKSKKENTPFYTSTERIRKAAPKHLTCQICLTSFPTTEEVSTHVVMHYTESNLTNYLNLRRPYECEECKDGVISKTQLIKHHRRHLNVNPFICKEAGCSFVGKNPDSLRHHMFSHGAHTQVCELCGARYRRRWELRVHLARAHRGEPTACQLCRRVFRNQFSYQAHLVTHKRAPRFTCSWLGCPKAYHSRAALEAHTRAHADERKYKCHLCSAAAYTSQSLLNRHLRMHQRKRISKCDKCSATFEDYGAFYRHRITSHGPWQPYRCKGCNQGYQSEAQLQKHNVVCELAIRMQSYEDSLQGIKDGEMVITTEQETEKEILQMETEDVLSRLKGQSLLVQPGNVNDLNKENFVLHELPPDGLLYIEVDPDSDEENGEVWQQ